MSIPFISVEDGERHIDWIGTAQALAAGHRLPKATIGDTFLYRGRDTVLSRAAWIEGMGIAVKTATVFPVNPERSLPAINGGVSLYSDLDGKLVAQLDFHLVTKWKTAGDSLLAALRLARHDSDSILVVGAGAVGASLTEAFSAGFPQARISVWNRTRNRAERLASGRSGLKVVDDLETAVRAADIVVAATMSSTPIIRGEWLHPGQHLNLIGAFRPDMREADDDALRRSRIYVDSFESTLEHIGELSDPLARGVIARGSVLADFYDLTDFDPCGDNDITLFKNGGGAHLDLMVADYILDRWRAGARQ